MLDKLPEVIYFVDDAPNNHKNFLEAINNFNEKEKRKNLLGQIKDPEIGEERKNLLKSISIELVQPSILLEGSLEDDKVITKETAGSWFAKEIDRSAILFLDHNLYGALIKHEEENKCCKNIVEAFKISSKRVLISTSSHSRARGVVREYIGEENLSNSDTNENFTGDNVKCMQILCQGILKWLERNSNTISDLYQYGWDNTWREKNSVPSSLKPFSHDCFDQKNLPYVNLAVSWLGLSPNPLDQNSVVFDGNSLKGLFMANYEEGESNIVPSREAPDRDIRKEYLVAALRKLDISCDLQPSVQSFKLPFTPGIAFLISLKEFLDALISDNSTFKTRKQPENLEFRQWSREISNNTQIMVHGIRIELFSDQDKKNGLSLMQKLLFDHKTNGATGALRNLLWGNSTNSTIQEDSKFAALFKVEQKLTFPVVAFRFGENSVELFW